MFAASDALTVGYSRMVIRSSVDFLLFQACSGAPSQCACGRYLRDQNTLKHLLALALSSRARSAHKPDDDPRDRSCWQKLTTSGANQEAVDRWNCLLLPSGSVVARCVIYHSKKIFLRLSEESGLLCLPTHHTTMMMVSGRQTDQTGGNKL